MQKNPPEKVGLYEKVYFWAVPIVVLRESGFPLAIADFFPLTHPARSVLIEPGDNEVFAGFTRESLKIAGCKAGTSGGRPAGASSIVLSLPIVLFPVSLVLSIS
jgi:hypothetical protein